jgi:hypothetical protein
MKYKYLLPVIILVALLVALFFKENGSLFIGKDAEPVTSGNKTGVQASTSPAKQVAATSNPPVNAPQPSNPMPSSALGVDKLLDENDKTERNQLIIQNHVYLLQIVKEVSELRKDKAKVPTHGQLVRWTQTLVNDAYLSNELGNNNLSAIDLSDLQTLKPELVPADNAISSVYMNPDYLKMLRPLVGEVFNIDANSLSEDVARSLALKIIDLTKRRKEQSEVFYLTLMHKYFPGKDYTMPQKIGFARQFVEAGDWKLAKYTLEFFQESLALPENQKDKPAIQQLINDIERGLTAK